MSAVAVASHPDQGVVFAADGVAYDAATGKVHGPVSKLDIYAHLNCVLGFAGIGDMGAALRTHIDAAAIATFDSLVTQLAQLLKNATFSLRAHYNLDREAAQATIVVGGWSEARQRFEVYRVGNYSKDAVRPPDDGGEWVADAATEPWTVSEITSGTWVSSAPPTDLLKTYQDLDRKLTGADYTALMVALNRVKSGANGASDGGPYGVGCHLQMVILTREKITTWIAHRWPDVVGEVVDPARGELLPPLPLTVP